MWFARSWIYANAIEEKRKSNAIKLNIIHNQLGNPTHLPPTTPPPHCLSYEWGQSKRKPGKSNQQTDNLKNSMATSLHSHRLSQAGRDREGGREGKRDREGSTGFSSSDNSLHLPQLLEALGASRATWAASKLIFDCELLASKFGSISNRCSLPTPSAIRLCNQSSAWLRSNGRGQLSVCVCVWGREHFWPDCTQPQLLPHSKLKIKFRKHAREAFDVRRLHLPRNNISYAKKKQQQSRKLKKNNTKLTWERRTTKQSREEEERKHFSQASIWNKH